MPSHNLAFLPCVLALAATATVGAADPALAPDRGTPRTWFVPLPAEEAERRYFGISVDSRGRVVAAQGDITIYDGFAFERLPRPGGVYTGALDIDARDRIWVGNSSELGYYVSAADGTWSFHSVREHLPPDRRNYELLWSVHCVGDAVIFVASHQIMRWRDGRMETWPMPAARRLFAQTDEGRVLILQRQPDPTTRAEPIFVEGAPTSRSSRLWSLGPAGEPRLMADRTLPIDPLLVVGGPDGETLVVPTNPAFGPAHVLDRNGELVRTIANPAWKQQPVTARCTTAGWIMGGVSSLFSIAYDGTPRFRFDEGSPDLPSVNSEPLAVGRDGRIWSVNVLGLLALDPTARVTHIGQAEGLRSTVSALGRIGGDLWFATTKGPFHQLPRQNPADTLRLEAIRCDALNIIPLQFVSDVQPAPGLVLLAGEHFAAIPLDGGPPVHPDAISFPNGRSFAQPWTGADGDIAIAASLRDVRLLRRTPTTPWPVLWQKTFPLIDRVYPLAGRRALLTDPAGRVWRLRWAPEAAGSVWKQVGEEQLLTSGGGLGRIVHMDTTPGQVLVFTHDHAWCLTEDSPAFRPLAHDGAPGVTPLAVALHADGRAWTIARTLTPANPLDEAGTYAIWAVKVRPGRIEGLNAPPIEVVDRIGVLASSWFESEAPGGGGPVWWFGGTRGVARVTLDGAPALKLDQAPFLLAVHDADGQRLPLDRHDAPVALTGERTLDVSYSFAQVAHPLPIAFQTWLEGVEAGWSPPTLDRRRHWERLPPGSFTLRVRAVDSAGQTSPVLSWPVTIPPHFHETWMLPALGCVAMGSLVWLASAWRTRYLRRRQAALEKIVTVRTEALRVANAQLREHGEKRTEMIGVISHELRTPVAAAQFLARDLRNALPSGVPSKQVDALEAQLGGLQRLIGGTLDVSRFELGLVPVRWRQERWAEFVRETLSGHAALAVDKNLIWHESIEGGDDYTVLVDSVNHQRVVHNLVGNAVKFTPAGSVRVNVRWRPGPAPLVWAEWEIEDSGPGLPPALWQGSRRQWLRRDLRPEHAPPSSGFGLALAMRLVDLAGGEIAFEVRPAGGTRCTLRLPLIALGPGVSEDAPPFAQHALVVEDDRTQLDHVVDVLEPLGVTIYPATTVAEAERLARERTYDLALLDLNLPDGTGLEVLAQLRATHQRTGTVVILTGQVTAELRKLCQESGCDRFESKPLTLRVALELLAAPAR